MAAGNISSFIVPLYALGARIVRTQVRGCNHGSSPLPLLPTLPLLLPTAACRAVQVFDQQVLGLFFVSISKEGKIWISFFLWISTTGKLAYCPYCNEKLVLEAFLEAALAQSSILICSPD